METPDELIGGQGENAQLDPLISMSEVKIIQRATAQMARNA